MAQPTRKRIKRRIVVAGQESPAERQSRTAVRFIMDNAYYNLILRAIRDGTPNTKIAEFGIARGWFDVNQKTVVSYLQYFRKAQPGICKPQANREDEYGFSDLFDGNSIIVDEETELLRLIKLQQARLGIAFRNERELGMLLQSNRREVEELRNLIIDLAKLRGVIGNTIDVNVNGYSASVKEDLKGIQQDEQSRGVIAMLVQDLVGVANG
jgi:hypothetical protein